MTSTRSTSTSTTNDCCARLTLALISCCSCWTGTSPFWWHGVPVRALEGPFHSGAWPIGTRFLVTIHLLKVLQSSKTLCEYLVHYRCPFAMLACVLKCQMTRSQMAISIEKRRRQIAFLWQKDSTTVLLLSWHSQACFHKRRSSQTTIVIVIVNLLLSSSTQSYDTMQTGQRKVQRRLINRKASTERIEL